MALLLSSSVSKHLVRYFKNTIIFLNLFYFILNLDLFLDQMYLKQPHSAVLFHESVQAE